MRRRRAPLGSFDGDTPASDNDSMEDDDDAPTAAMMTEPKLELPCPPGTDLGVLPCWPPALLPSPAARVFAF